MTRRKKPDEFINAYAYWLDRTHGRCAIVAWPDRTVVACGSLEACKAAARLLEIKPGVTRASGPPEGKEPVTVVYNAQLPPDVQERHDQEAIRVLAQILRELGIEAESNWQVTG